MISSFEDRPRAGELVKAEWDQRVSRETATVTASGPSTSYTVGQTVTLTGDAEQGFEAAPAAAGTAGGVICTEAINLADGDQAKVGVIVRGPVMLDQDALTYPDGLSENNKASQRAALRALGIVLRREPIKQGGPGDELE